MLLISLFVLLYFFSFLSLSPFLSFVYSLFFWQIGFTSVFVSILLLFFFVIINYHRHCWIRVVVLALLLQFPLFSILFLFYLLPFSFYIGYLLFSCAIFVKPFYTHTRSTVLRKSSNIVVLAFSPSVCMVLTASFSFFILFFPFYFYYHYFCLSEPFERRYNEEKGVSMIQWNLVQCVRASRIL